MFGPQAQLDIAGSFMATMANAFAFADGSLFSAVNPEAPPLLTVNLSIGLQYGHGLDGQDLGDGLIESVGVLRTGGS